MEVHGNVHLRRAQELFAPPDTENVLAPLWFLPLMVPDPQTARERGGTLLLNPYKVPPFDATNSELPTDRELRRYQTHVTDVQDESLHVKWGPGSWIG